MNTQLHSQFDSSSSERPLRDQIRAFLQEEIQSGRLSAGTSLSEPQLASRLGVSRTPVREALVQLEHDQWLKSDLNRGFQVAPLSRSEIEELYPVLAALEMTALRISGLPSPEALVRLNEINQELATGVAPIVQFELDRQFHTLLLEHCLNSRLASMIQSMRAVAHRYDIVFWREAGDVRLSVTEHTKILEALSAGKLPLAAKRLEKHWMSGVQPFLRWLDQREWKPVKRARPAKETA